MAPPDVPEWKFPVAFHFNVIVDGEQISFNEVSGIDSSLETLSVMSGGDNSNCYSVPKSRKHGDLVLKRGVVRGSDSFFKWCKDTLSTPLSKGCIKPKSLTVSLLGAEGEALATWSFKNAYPVDWSVGSLNAEKSEIAIETVKLKYYSMGIEV